MFIPAKHIYGLPVEGTDGRVGTVYDILFDDQSWIVSHLVVKTEHWFSGRQVLLSPDVVQRADWPGKRLYVRLTRQQLEDSPSVDSQLPVARRRTLEVAQVLVWEAYWSGLAADAADIEGDPHLRNTWAVTGHRVHCADGELGRIDDFLIDDETWFIRYLALDARHWWLGKRVLIEPMWVESISWQRREVRLTLPREQVQRRPAYDGAALPAADAERVPSLA
jgi:sporulation protein YlmC with PRC-barrel domain